MSLKLRIPGTDFDHECHERSERRATDSLDRLPGQMMNLAGAAIIGSMTIGFLGAMFRR